jgi:hypothetical protein
MCCARLAQATPRAVARLANSALQFVNSFFVADTMRPFPKEAHWVELPGIEFIPNAKIEITAEQCGPPLAAEIDADLRKNSDPEEAPTGLGR